jgi:hypothetical protein
MNRHACAGILAVFLALSFLTGCSSSSKPAPPVVSIAATSGSGQSATVGMAFAAPLVATVTTGGAPTSGVTVTFTAPNAGASGTFAGGVNTATTNASGVATSATFTANTTAGVYAVTASVAGASTPASFSLTNTAGAAASITATSGTPQNAAINTAFAAPLVATVLDSFSNPVSGATVTFTAPTSGASGTFVNGTNTDTETTGGTGAATSTTFTANGTIGGPYTVAATVPGVATEADFSLTNTAPPKTFVFYVTGMEVVNNIVGPNFYAVAGSVTIDSNGNVLGGEQDYNDGFGFTSPAGGDSIIGGTLTVDGTGQGTLTLNTTDNSDFGGPATEILGVQFPNANHALIVQFDGNATSSGSLDLQTATQANGNFAFTLSGVDPNYFSVVYGGVFTASSGSVSGVYDVDDFGAGSTPTLGTAFSGTTTGTDAFGRGTVTGTGIAGTLAYYIVGPEAMRIIDIDPSVSGVNSDSFVGSAFGQGAGTFSNASLGSSVFGVESNSFGGFVYAAAGQFTTDGAGTVSAGVADDDEQGFIVSAAPIAGTYSIASNGYGRLTITPGDLGDVSFLGIYMTDPNLNLNDPNNTTSGLGGALVADLDGYILNGTGVLTPQTDTSPASFTGNYAFGAQDFWGCSGICEFDFVGQGSVTSGAFAGTGLVSDPLAFFSANLTDSGVTFVGTATPDGVNAGRYTIPLAITIPGGSPVGLQVVIYQASGGQLFWMDEDGFSLFLGPLEQQVLAGLHAAKRTGANTKPKRKQ